MIFFKADDSLLVDDEVGSLGAVSFFIENAISFDHLLSPRVTEERVVQFKGFREGLL